ncbi:hypothetical protein BP6252_08200 [Coleophoma cylindrospora]|uniref:Enoyl reductase (ER) domain-containing protein n=1 Tax=Coleophoma cylindrospora TaxID=1849047 RepID=A0A3D8RC47_9HELO|nr:hypothetical protein BP6252_08200 [Coleophoma cylindrospora]
MATATRMRAVLLKTPGPASNLHLVELPIPRPTNGQVLIRVKAFGLNRSELLTRRFGRAPVGPVQLPRVLGVEAAGVVEAAPGYENEFPKGAIVMTAVGGMGIVFDGGYAEYTCVPKANVQVLQSGAEELGWELLGALPEMLQTAHGCLFRSLKIKAGDSLLIRGGTTSVGLAAAAIAHNAGATVITTTRKSDEATAHMLRDNGADHIVVDDGSSVSQAVQRLQPSGVDKVLELIGATTLVESLSLLNKDGICCLVGLVGGSHLVADFNPLAMIQTERYLTAYGERNFAASNLPLDELIQQIKDGSLKIHTGKVFQMTQIVEAHEYMENNESNGKIVVLTGM